MSQITRKYIPLHNKYRVNIPAKHLQTSSRLHGVTSQERVIVMVTVVITSNITVGFSFGKLVLSHRIFTTNTLKIFHVNIGIWGEERGGMHVVNFRRLLENCCTLLITKF
jgi:hypothetical protein